MWVFFAPAGGQTTVTLKRPTAGTASRLVKSWMLDLAGRLDAAMPLEFQEEAPLHEVEGDIEASRSDLAQALGTAASIRLITTWEHAGMMVSAAPLTWVMLAPAGPRGVHHVTVAAESAVAARQLLAKLMQGVLKPGICAVYSEQVELDEEVRNRASGNAGSARLAITTCSRAGRWSSRNATPSCTPWSPPCRESFWRAPARDPGTLRRPCARGAGWRPGSSAC